MSDQPPFAFYGTLMPAYRRHMEDCSFGKSLGACMFRGDMYSVTGMFPAVVHGEGVVHGELWQPAAWDYARAVENFDAIEGWRPDDPQWSHYRRERVRLLEPDIEAWVYVYNHPVAGMIKVEDGDWMTYRSTQAAVESLLRGVWE